MGILFCLNILSFLFFMIHWEYYIAYFASMRRILLFVTLISLLISNMGISGVFANVVPGKSPTPITDSLTNWTTEYQSVSEIATSVASQAGNSSKQNEPTVVASDPASGKSSDSSKITVITTEQIPGANCTCIADWASRTEDVNGNTLSQGSGEAACNNITTRKYSCEVTSGMTAFQGIMGTLIKWFIYIIMLLGVLAIVGAGIMMAFGSDSEEYTKKAKGWAMNIIIWLVILFTFSYILKLLAPWIYQ